VGELSAFEATPLAGTEKFAQAAFSPDGTALVTVDSWRTQAISKLPLDGGALEEIAVFAGSPAGLHWDGDGTIWLGAPQSGLWRVPAAGGVPEPATTLAPNESSHRYPFALPDGRGVLFTVNRGYRYFVAHLSPATGEHQVLFEGVAGAHLDDGYLVFARGSDDGAFETGVARTVHFAHPARADGLGDVVGA
jgi:hypothetical protein